MTSQAFDTVMYHGKVYDLIETLGGRLFSPLDFGIELMTLKVPGWRNYRIAYSIEKDNFYLSELSLNHLKGRCVPLNGRLPELKGREAIYKGMSMKVPYTGELTVARYLYWDLGDHEKEPQAGECEEVLNLIFVAGILTGVTDGFEAYKKTGTRITTITIPLT